MKLQKKLNKLVEILNTIKSKSRRNYALSLLDGIVNEVNKLGIEINKYYAKEHGLSEPELEIEKYILALMIYGYTQEGISCINKETIIFVNKYKKYFNDIPKAKHILDIQHWLYDFILINEREPIDFEEFKKHVYDARNS